jgi:hypothetical protein
MFMLLSVGGFPQNNSSYQIGTIMEVKRHEPSSNSGHNQYDISVRVGDTLYLVLYTAAPGAKTAEYSAGTDRPVLINRDTMTFSDLRGNPVAVPILSRKSIKKSGKPSPKS